MKKALLFFSLIISSFFLSNAQCTIDTTNTDQFNPPYLNDGYVGQAYSSVVQAYLPTSVSVDSVIFKRAATGVRVNNYSYACNPPGCQIPSNTPACIIITGTPAVEDTGYVDLIIYLTYTDLGVNDSTDVFFIHVLEQMSSVEEKETFREKDISVHPVPAKDVLNIGIDFKTQVAGLTIQLHDVLGRVVSHEFFSSPLSIFRHSIDVAGLGSGLYYAYIKAGESVTVRKVWVE